MADDHATWRKNLPEDFQGKHADQWDGEVDVGVIYKSGVAVVAAFVIALGVCWLVMIALYGLQEEPYFSPIAEANERRLPPSPLLQASPEAEMDEMLAELDLHLGSYGWVDELDNRVHIPIERAMELVLASGMPAAPVGVEPAVDEPFDLEGVTELVEPNAGAEAGRTADVASAAEGGDGSR
ncbi:MAG: hypothetical protein AAGC60_15325 [Acidobacteriota bacterium]